MGTPDELVDFLGRHGEAGATCVFLQTMDMHDLDHIEVVATDVAPQLR